MADPPCPRPGAEQLCFAGSAIRMSCAAAPQQQPPQPVPTGATTAALGPAGHHHQGSPEGGDLECLVCREPYNYARSPKLLSCQHSFCAVCLKLLLCVQEDTWSITCPLCRQVTVVPGGLICSLRDQEAVMGRLAGLGVEVRLCPQGLQRAAASRVGCPGLAGEDEQDAVTANRAAARRLAVHLLLLVILIVLILPFVYPGIIRWVLAIIIALALLMATLFCCYSHNQGSCWLCPRTYFCREQKHSQITSIA